jgi:hypothetical protein
MDMIEVDLIIGLPKSPEGYSNILTVLDIATGYTWIKPLMGKTMLEVAQRLLAIQYQFGQPKIIFTDNGSELKNKLMRHITDLSKIDNRHGTAYYPQGHGAVERKNRDISDMIRKVIESSKESWPLHCDYMAFCINSRISNRTGSMPFALMFGRIPNGFDDFRLCSTSMKFDQASWETHLERLNRIVHPSIDKKVNLAQVIRNEQLDRSRKIKSYAVGQLVLVRDVTQHSKWDGKYEGPFTICSITKAGTYRVKDHSGAILPFTFPANHIRATPHLTESIDKSYPVKKIIRHTYSPELGFDYLVQFAIKDWSPVWIQANLFDSPTLIEKYWRDIRKDRKKLEKYPEAAIASEPFKSTQVSPFTELSTVIPKPKIILKLRLPSSKTPNILSQNQLPAIGPTNPIVIIPAVMSLSTVMNPGCHANENSTSEEAPLLRQDTVPTPDATLQAARRALQIHIAKEQLTHSNLSKNHTICSRQTKVPNPPDLSQVGGNVEL